jgi:hypothetical protein
MREFGRHSRVSGSGFAHQAKGELNGDHEGRENHPKW